jgi:hypothetical protein
VLFCCVAPPTVDARTSTPSKNEAATLLHLDFGYLGIQGLSSTQSAHRSLLQPQRSHPHHVVTAGGFQLVGFYSSLIV